MYRRMIIAPCVIVTLATVSCGRAPEKVEQTAPTGLTELAIQDMVTTEITTESPEPIDMSAATEISAEELLSSYGSEGLIEAVDLNNHDMLIEQSCGVWEPVAVKVDNTFYLYDNNVSGQLIDVSADITYNGIIYTESDKHIDERVDCTLMGGSIVTDDGFTLDITTYGCLSYSTDGYAIILGKDTNGKK